LKDHFLDFSLQKIDLKILFEAGRLLEAVGLLDFDIEGIGK
jgi:hypothetical protein